MHRSLFRRSIGILVLGGALAAPPLAAQSLAGQRLDGPQALWSFVGRLVALWGENGSSIDPYGRQVTEQARTAGVPPAPKTHQVRPRTQDSPAGLRRVSSGES
jgi:hypothetical protein